MDPIIQGSPLCLTSDELLFDPGTGYTRVQQFRGAEAQVTAKQQELAALGWRTRITYSGDGVSLDASTPELTDPGDGGTTITGSEDVWDFTTEIIDASIWASPMLHRWVKTVFSYTDLQARQLLIVWRATIDQNLKVKYGPPPTFDILKDTDGITKLPGPTAYENFNPRDKNGQLIPIGPERTMLADLYQWISANQASNLTSLVSIQRRRQVPVESTIRFTTDAIQKVWLPPQFIIDFNIPSHIQRLLPPVPDVFPFTTARWGYRLRRHDASASTANNRVTEIVEWAFGAWNALTHEIIG
jgi:hypothetical protein